MKHIFLDMDGCITESRQNISGEMYVKLSKLPHDIVVISGAERERMVKQLQKLNCTIMAQSGNDTDLWKRTLTNSERKKILQHINKIVKLKPDMIDDRDCQIALSLVGHSADILDKKKYDPTGEIRIGILKEKPFIHDKLECRIGGTTCIDYTRKDGTKGKNIQRFIKVQGWDKRDCIYFGDKLMKGGNDESVIGIIRCIGVATPSELMVKLKEYE